ncbi:hypothetical protein NDI52_33850 [Leptolyngbya sp. PL-A3]|uniref:hypothetical protein n=1 Tax=Leptolyngbya sp. PL-A3 TaxID=2933911 RepID=UPI0032994ED5
MQPNPISEYIKENPLIILGSAILGIAFLMNGGFDQLQDRQQFSSQLKDLRQQSERGLVQSRIQEAALLERSELAADRFLRNCFQVYTPTGSQQSVLVPNQPVTQLGTGIPLVDGTVVCDYQFGTTGVITNGVVSDIAVYQGNVQDLIQQAPKNGDVQADG